MFYNSLLRKIAKRAFRTRIPPTALHRLLAWEYWARRISLNELMRIVYYQPIFETQCKKVGEGFRLQLCPDSKVPLVGKVDVEIGANTQISARLTLTGAPSANPKSRIQIGEHCFLGDRCVLRSGREIVIGNYVLIGTNVLISCDPGHPRDAKERRSKPAPAELLGSIEIGDDAMIYYNAAIVRGVKIGRGAIVAANSVVTQDVPPFTLVAGNPARVVRVLDRPEQEVEKNPLRIVPPSEVLQSAAGAGIISPPPPAEQLYMAEGTGT